MVWNKFRFPCIFLKAQNYCTSIAIRFYISCTVIMDLTHKLSFTEKRFFETTPPYPELQHPNILKNWFLFKLGKLLSIWFQSSEDGPVLGKTQLLILSTKVSLGRLTQWAREHSAGGTHWDPKQIQWGWLSIPAGYARMWKKFTQQI